MKLFKNAQSKILIMATLVFALAFSLCANLKFSNSSAKAEDEPIIVETELKNIVFQQIAGGGYIGFELTVSDYNVAAETNDRESAVEDYIVNVCNYWSNFSSMNSRGASFPQVFIYWNGGAGGNVVGSGFANTFTHRLSLNSIEYGFTVNVPAGTLFPSFEYVNALCVGTPKMFKTVSDKAFYYDGNGFVEISFDLATQRAQAEVEVGGINLSLYHDAERQQVKALIKTAKEQLSISFSKFAIDETKASFYSALSQIMTKADYVELDNLKANAKTELATFFADFSKDDYEDAGWSTLLAIQSESEQIIDGIAKLDQVADAVTAIKDSAGSVVRKDGKTDFETYRDKAKLNLEGSFDASLYNEEEKTLGANLVSEGTKAILDATTYDEVDALEASYVSQIKELKKAEKEQTSETDEPKLNWIFAIIGGGALLVCASVVIVLVILKNRKKGVKKDEE